MSLVGHGKTVLAERLGAALVPRGSYLKVDCTQCQDQYSMFGAANPYVGAADGAKLNNHLAAHSGKPCVVLLDEIEKTGKDVWNALLNPFDKVTTRTCSCADDDACVSCHA